ncbi:MAG: hypothetical protein M3384_20605 [Acidobacteriota bacterium]|nr:hypothetical protein [Acidobacteriota bacterium]
MENNTSNWENPGVYERVGCALQISGKGFDPDAFLEESNLPKEKIRFKGALGIPAEFRDKFHEPDIPELSNPLDVFDMSNLLIAVSEAANLSSQIEEAILFFKTYLGDLRKISVFPGVEEVLLSFIVEPEKTPSEFQDFPQALYELAAEIGIKGISYGEINAEFENRHPKKSDDSGAAGK